jgi:hypothetical protein
MNTRRILTNLFAVTIALAISTTTFAQTTPPSPGAPEQSNKGGALRGLDRADQVAGEHGQQGRDRARAAQERTNRPERSDRPERSQRAEKPGR